MKSNARHKPVHVILENRTLVLYNVSKLKNLQNSRKLSNCKCNCGVSACARQNMHRVGSGNMLMSPGWNEWGYMWIRDEALAHYVK